MSIADARRSQKAIVTKKKLEELKAAEEKPKDYDPPPNEVQPSTWLTLDLLARNGARYRARVLYTVPTFDDIISAAQLQTLIVGNGIGASFEAQVFAKQMSYMITNFAPESLPTWWDESGGRDFAPYGELYAQAVAYENAYFRSDEDEAAVPVPTGNAAPNARGSARANSRAVERPVQPAAQRREVLSPDPETGA
jgi:hypothetical protein